MQTYSPGFVPPSFRSIDRYFDYSVSVAPSVRLRSWFGTTHAPGGKPFGRTRLTTDRIGYLDDVELDEKRIVSDGREVPGVYAKLGLRPAVYADVALNN